MLGMPLGNYEVGYTNSVVAFARSGAVWRYDKQHLVPFGEFIPPLFKWFTEMMNIPLGDFNRGAIEQASFEWQGQRLALNICYEDLFGEELGRTFATRRRPPPCLSTSATWPGLATPGHRPAFAHFPHARAGV